MSGGSLNYICYTLEEHTQDFDDKELNDLVSDLSQLFHDREWYLSGDTGEGTWNEARDAFKRKWMTPDGREKRLIAYIDEEAEKLRQLVDIDRRRYCESCEHFAPEKNSRYGNCKHETGCLMYRKSTACEKYEVKT